MTTIDKITAIVNKAIPKRLELKFGCEIAGEGFKYTYICFDDGHKVLLGNDICTLYGDDILSLDVLGTPVTIIDILRVLPNTYLFCSNTTLKILKTDKDINGALEHSCILTLDPTKPLIKDQEPSTIEAIYQLIK